MSDTLFILGAGASRHTGAPVMDGFLNAAEDVRDRMAGEDPDREHFDRLFEFVHELKPILSKATLDIENIEDVYAAAEMGAILGLNSFGGLGGSIKRVIVRTFEEKTVVNTQVVEGRRTLVPSLWYGRLVDEIRAKGQNGRRELATRITRALHIDPVRDLV